MMYRCSEVEPPRRESRPQRVGVRMTSDDPKLPRYGDLTIHGTTLTDLAQVLTRHVAAPWSRATDLETSWAERPPVKDRPLIFHHEPDGRLPGAHLYLFTREDGVSYVSNVVPTEAQQLTEPEYNGLLQDFHETAVEAAVREFGAESELELADYDLAERAGVEVRDALVRFSRTANKSTGASHPMDAERFDDFVITVSHLERARRPSAGTIAEWLVADGWSDETAWELSIQYEQGLRLLDRASLHG